MKVYAKQEILKNLITLDEFIIYGEVVAFYEKDIEFTIKYERIKK